MTTDLKTEIQKNKNTAGIFRFKEFQAYKDAWEFRKELKRLSRDRFPQQEQYGLTSQLCRALDSIIVNITEGSDRYSDMDFSRFLNTSLTSVNEVVSCLDGALDDEYITKQEYNRSLWVKI